MRPDADGYEIEILAYRRPSTPLGLILHCEEVDFDAQTNAIPQ
jgi:hypothetical protein